MWAMIHLGIAFGFANELNGPAHKVLPAKWLMFGAQAVVGTIRGTLNFRSS